MLLKVNVGLIVGLSILAVFIILVIALIAFFWKGYNNLVKLKNNTDEAFSTMDIYMKKRYDLIPNLVEVVKGYAKHEKSTLEGVMQARYSCLSANNDEEKAKYDNMLTGTLKTLFNVTENYPELKADKNFTQLQNTLYSLEVEIVNARKYYNGCVKTYNVTIESFPSNILAKMFKFEKRTMFEIANADEREAPKVSF